MLESLAIHASAKPEDALSASGPEELNLGGELRKWSAHDPNSYRFVRGPQSLGPAVILMTHVRKSSCRVTSSFWVRLSSRLFGGASGCGILRTHDRGQARRSRRVSVRVVPGSVPLRGRTPAGAQNQCQSSGDIYLCPVRPRAGGVCIPRDVILLESSGQH
jgi:hypothetical protein